MLYSTKIALVLLRDLPNWQKLNASAFLASAMPFSFPKRRASRAWR